jgi:O-antigen/teichoic acid export membrane protein
MLPLLAMGTWPVMLTQTIDPILFAIGQPRYIAFGCFLSFLFYIVGIPVTFSLYGPVGAVISVALSNIPPWLIVTYALGREKISVLRQDITMTLIFLAIVGLLTLFRSLLGIGFPSIG